MLSASHKAFAQACTPTGANQTCTNAGATSGATVGIDDTGTLTLTNTSSGSIVATGANGRAVQAATAATVTNAGTIAANGTNGRGINTFVADVTNTGTISGDARGILGLDLATVTNSGTISSASGIAIASNTTVNLTNTGTVAGFSRGVIGNVVTNVTNSGTISASNGNAVSSNITSNVTNTGTIFGSAVGVFAGVSSNVINSGTITSQGTGVSSNPGAGNSSNVTNSGTISSTGVGGNGVFGETVNVTNSGLISANAANGFGISGTNTNVTNRGTISATGVGGIGISSGSSANVINSGTIIGTQAALDLSNDADRLTILPGSKIIGAINFYVGRDSVDMRAGNQNLTFDSLSSVTVTGTVPFVVSGNRIVSVDPTAFASAGTTLADFARSVSGIVPDVGGIALSGGAGVSAFAAPDATAALDDAFASLTGVPAYAAGDRIAFKTPTVSYADGTTVWARAFGGQHIQPTDGALLRNVSTWIGGAIGLDKWLRPDLRLGAFVGSGVTRNSVDFGTGTDSTLGFAGAYARYTTGAWFAHAAIQGGGLHSFTSRLVNNNLVAGGLENATAGYDGWYVSPELTLGHRLALGTLADSHYALTPSLQVRYLYAGFDGYTEAGTTAPLTVGSRNTQNVEERAELKLTRTTQLAPRAQLVVNLTGGAIGTQRVGGSAIAATLLAQPLAFTLPGASNVFGGFGGAGIEWQTGNVAVFAAVEYLAWQDAGSIVSGRGGIRVGF